MSALTLLPLRSRQSAQGENCISPISPISHSLGKGIHDDVIGKPEPIEPLEGECDVASVRRPRASRRGRPTNTGKKTVRAISNKPKAICLSWIKIEDVKSQSLPRQLWPHDLPTGDWAVRAIPTTTLLHGRRRKLLDATTGRIPRAGHDAGIGRGGFLLSYYYCVSLPVMFQLC